MISLIKGAKKRRGHRNLPTPVDIEILDVTGNRFQIAFTVERALKHTTLTRNTTAKLLHLEFRCQLELHTSVD